MWLTVFHPKGILTETGFTVTHIFVFLCCFQTISLLDFFYFVVVFALYFHSVYHL